MSKPRKTLSQFLFPFSILEIFSLRMQLVTHHFHPVCLSVGWSTVQELNRGNQHTDLNSTLLRLRQCHSFALFKYKLLKMLRSSGLLGQQVQILEKMHFASRQCHSLSFQAAFFKGNDHLHVHKFMLRGLTNKLSAQHLLKEEELPAKHTYFYKVGIR